MMSIGNERNDLFELDELIVMEVDDFMLDDLLDTAEYLIHPDEILQLFVIHNMTEFT